MKRAAMWFIRMAATLPPEVCQVSALLTLLAWESA